MLSELDSIPIDENRLLIDYIFPKAKNLISDHSTLVKISLASNLGSLAIVSKRFYSFYFFGKATIFHSRFYEEHLSWSLDSSNKITKSDQDKSQTAPLLEEEKLLILNEYQALVDSVSELFVNLCGSENEVRICLFSPTNLDLICSFFGPDRGMIYQYGNP
jgi:hypothetical protein